MLVCLKYFIHAQPIVHYELCINERAAYCALCIMNYALMNAQPIVHYAL